MGRRQAKEIQIHASVSEYEIAQVYVSDLLKRNSISQEVRKETMLVFETVFDAILQHSIAEGAMLNISGQNRLGDITLIIGYEGDRFTPTDATEAFMSPELRIMEGYSDKISCNYSLGYNTIRISVKKSPRSYFALCGVGILVAMFVYIPCSFVMDEGSRHVFINDYVLPVERLFGNAMLMVGAPVTLFSMMKNASDTFIISQRSSNARKLQVISLVTSVLAVILALGMGYALVYGILGLPESRVSSSDFDLNWTFNEFVSSMVPESILEPLASVSPIPLIIVALLATYALCSSQSHFDTLKMAIDACYELFSRMLHVVMVALPFCCFLAFFDELLSVGMSAFLNIALEVGLIFVCTSILIVTYAIRLRVRGIPVISFTKRLMPLLRENAAIASVIEAVPFNVRYCVKNFGFDRKKTESSLRVLSQIDLDGNSFIIMLVAIVSILNAGVELTVVQVAVIAALVIFLSFGAPNQPGSILIGVLIIFNYLQLYDMFCMAFYLEVFLGGWQNLINVISSIVSIAEQDPEHCKA